MSTGNNVKGYILRTGRVTPEGFSEVVHIAQTFSGSVYVTVNFLSIHETEFNRRNWKWSFVGKKLPEGAEYIGLYPALRYTQVSE